MWVGVTVLLLTERPKNNERIQAGDARELARWICTVTEDPTTGCSQMVIPETAATHVAVMLTDRVKWVRTMDQAYRILDYRIPSG